MRNVLVRLSAASLLPICPNLSPLRPRPPLVTLVSLGRAPSCLPLGTTVLVAMLVVSTLADPKAYISKAPRSSRVTLSTLNVSSHISENLHCADGLQRLREQQLLPTIVAVMRSGERPTQLPSSPVNQRVRR